MLSTRFILPMAFASVALLWGCQEQASSPVGPENSDIMLNKRPHDHGDDDGPATKVTWSEANLVLGVGGDFQVDPSSTSSTLVSTCPGTPGAKSSNPTVEWKDDDNHNCVNVTPNGSDVPLTNDASLIVGVKKGSTEVTVQFSIQDKVGPDGIQYRTDKFVVPDDVVNGPFTGAGFTLHVHSTVEIWRLKGHTGGPKLEMVGTINIGDIVYSN